MYKHRDLDAAAREVRAMMSRLPVAAGARVLDLCCGMGRHALTLAELGYEVSGFDLSPVLLKQACALDERQAVEWVRGDMRELPFADGEFDAVVNFFTSFGYFAEDVENQQVLTELARVLRTGGAFLIDFLNPLYVQKNLVPLSERIEGDVRIVERRRIDAGFVKKNIQIFADEHAGDKALTTAVHQVRAYEECVKLYTLHDFERMLNGTGLQLEQCFGHYDGTPYDPEHSPRLLMIGRKDLV